MKSFPRSSSRHPLRFILLDLHASGAIRVFRRPSLFRLWAPLRENFAAAAAFPARPRT